MQHHVCGAVFVLKIAETNKATTMKKSIIPALLLILSVTALQAQTTYTETRNVSGFSKVSFAVAGEVYIDLGQSYSVVLEGDRDYINDIETRVEGKDLVIKRDKWFDSGNRKVTVRITMPALEGISVSGSGKVTVNDPVRGDDLDVAISGSGKALLGDVTVKNIECHISGSGSLNIAGTGTVDNLVISISGSGNYKGEAAKVGTLRASISGSGNCDCYVTDLLKAAISGSGSVYYSGNPKIDAAISGSGKVRTK
jgi:hypothetical protein